MVNRRTQCLMEAKKLGFTLLKDPTGDRNRCFYQCIAMYLDIEVNDVISLVEEYMACHQVVSVINEV